MESLAIPADLVYNEDAFLPSRILRNARTGDHLVHVKYGYMYVVALMSAHYVQAQYPRLNTFLLAVLPFGLSLLISHLDQFKSPT